MIRLFPNAFLIPTLLIPAAALILAACTDLNTVGRAPEFSPIEGSNQQYALYSGSLPETADPNAPTDAASLWTGSTESLLGDRRAARRGDILTVVIEINDSAAIKNSTDRNRTGSKSMGIPQFFGIPQRIDEKLPEGASMETAVETNSNSTFKGAGNVARSEKLTLRVAATVVEELPNGVLKIEGQQEVRVNYELRELIVTGFVRPADITRQNEITYDKIAGARVAYGGRGQISDFQQPTYGQQISDIVLPF